MYSLFLVPSGILHSLSPRLQWLNHRSPCTQPTMLCGLIDARTFIFFSFTINLYLSFASLLCEGGGRRRQQAHRRGRLGGAPPFILCSLSVTF